MGYIEDSSMVRVDFFLVDENGRPYKWYATEGVKWLIWQGSGLGGALIHDAFLASLRRSLKHNGRLRHEGMLAICLEPYHEHAHPIVAMVV